MPTYEYQCKTCSEITKKRHSIKEKLTECTSCNSANSLERLLGDFIILNKKESGKLVKNFIDNHKNIELKSLAYKGNELDLTEIKKLASLPTYDEAISMLMSIMQAPIQKLMATMVAVPTKMVRTLDAVKGSKN